MIRYHHSLTVVNYVSSVSVGHNLLNRMPSVSLVCSEKSKHMDSRGWPPLKGPHNRAWVESPYP